MTPSAPGRSIRATGRRRKYATTAGGRPPSTSRSAPVQRAPRAHLTGAPTVVVLRPGRWWVRRVSERPGPGRAFEFSGREAKARGYLFPLAEGTDTLGWWLIE